MEYSLTVVIQIPYNVTHVGRVSFKAFRYVAKQESVLSNFRPDWIDITGNDFANLNRGFRGIDDCGRHIHRFLELRVISHAESDLAGSLVIPITQNMLIHPCYLLCNILILQ
jgi:hypothetical protein